MRSTYFVLAWILPMLFGVFVSVAKGQASPSSQADTNVSFARALIFESPLQFASEITAGNIFHVARTNIAVSDSEGGGGVCTTLLSPLAAPYPWVCGQTGAYGAQGVSFEDVNLDGNLDIVTTDADDPLIDIGYGNGAGEFKDTPFLYGDCGASTNLATVADLNGDGIPDVVVAVIGDPGCISIFFGLGNKQFAPVADVASGGISPQQVAVGDLNHDGIPDLVVPNFGDPFHGDFGNVAVLLGNGDGTFQPPVAYTGLVQPFQVTLADFNGDGNLDMAVVALGDNAIFIALGKGDGTFSRPTKYPLRNNPGPIVVADFNGDGKLDIAMPRDTANPPYRGAVGVMLGNGDGTFQKALLFPVDVGPTELAVGDFNGDGRPDIAALGGTIPSTISILLNTTPWPEKK